MKTFFSNLPLGRKLTLITMLISGVALLLACAAFAIYEQTIYRRTMARDFAVIADMFDDNVAAGLQFGDREAMEQTLRTLSANRHIVAAAVYNHAGDVVARYQRTGLPADFTYPPVQPTSQGFTADRLDTFQDITLGGEVTGVVYISADLQELTARAWRYTIVVALLLAACLLVALLLASRLQTLISAPIVSLAKIVAIVATGKDYSVRAPQHGHDEVGRLIDGFNEMLHQIQTRDSELEGSRRELETRVEERTKELAKSLSLLNATLESTTDGIAAVDLAGSVVSFNSKFMELWQFPPAMLARRDAVEMRAHTAVQVKDPGAFLDLTRDLPVMPSTGRFDLFEHKDGRTFERYVFPQLIEGRRVGTVIIWRDITDRRQAERLVRQSEERLRSLIDTARDAIFTIAADGTFSSLNPAVEKIAGVTRAEWLGKPFASMVHPDDLPRAREMFQRIMRGEQAPVHELRGNPALRINAIMEMTLTAQKNEDGQIIGLLGIGRDIADRKQAEAELEQVHKQLLDASRQAGMAEVATGVLHNVGNVLNSVNVSATLVSDQIRHSKAANLAKVCVLLNQHKADLGAFLTADPKGLLIPAYLDTLAGNLVEERVTVIAELESLRKNIEHIKDIVAMQQNYAKNSGFTETISLPDLIEDALRINAGSLARHGVDLARDYQVRPVATVDKHKVMQILINLIRNAKYACDESGRADKLITVRLTADERCNRIAISDNGVGIPAENITRIFNHGFTTRKTGHGFGLHSGALAAKELGGALVVTSAGAGHGATFILELPHKAEPVSAPALAASLP